MIDRIASVLYGGNLADCHFPEYFRRKAGQVLEVVEEDRLRVAARKVLKWADDLKPYADDGTALVPVFEELRAALEEKT